MRPTPYFNTWGVSNNTYDRIINVFEAVVANMPMATSWGFGPIWNFNANNTPNGELFPAIWFEPIGPCKIVSSIQGIRVYKCVFYLYAMDRIDKGDDNYQQVLSSTDGMLKDIMAEIREGQFARLNYVIVDNSQDQEMTPVIEVTDEYVNGWRIKVALRIPDILTPCNVPITPVRPQWQGMFNVLDASVDQVIGDYSNITWNVIDAGVDNVLGTIGDQVSATVINTIDASIDTVL